jgi:hypothetical protein
MRKRIELTEINTPNPKTLVAIIKDSFKENYQPTLVLEIDGQSGFKNCPKHASKEEVYIDGTYYTYVYVDFQRDALKKKINKLRSEVPPQAVKEPISAKWTIKLRELAYACEADQPDISAQLWVIWRSCLSANRELISMSLGLLTGVEPRI